MSGENVSVRLACGPACETSPSVCISHIVTLGNAIAMKNILRAVGSAVGTKWIETNVALFQKWRWGKKKKRSERHELSGMLVLNLLWVRWVWVSIQMPFPQKRQSAKVAMFFAVIACGSQWFSNCWMRNVHLERLPLAPSNLTGWYFLFFWLGRSLVTLWILYSFAVALHFVNLTIAPMWT